MGYGYFEHFREKNLWICAGQIGLDIGALSKCSLPLTPEWDTAEGG